MQSEEEKKNFLELTAKLVEQLKSTLNGIDELRLKYGSMTFDDFIRLITAALNIQNAIRTINRIVEEEEK